MTEPKLAKTYDPKPSDQLVSNLARQRSICLQPIIKGKALYYHDAAAECDWQSAYGARVDLYFAGSAHSVPPDSRPRCLWQPGTDHAGIATQMVVERQLAAENIDRRDLGRDALYERSGIGRPSPVV